MPVLWHAIVRHVELVPNHVVTQILKSRRDAAPVGVELGAHQTPHVLKEVFSCSFQASTPATARVSLSDGASAATSGELNLGSSHSRRRMSS